MYKQPTHPITKETRARNTLARSKTRNLIVQYIYEQTGCEKCRVGHFCTRDGDKWGCLSYNNIAEHLNHIGHPTSQGNNWVIKTVRDQVTWGKRKITEQEKEKRIEQENKKRNEEVIWETHELTNITEQMLDELKKEFHTTQVAPGEDVDFLLDELRQTITESHERGSSVSIIRMEILPTS